MSSSESAPIGSGTLVGSNVRLKRLLGQGGMGSVWVAEHEALQTEVAVKFISAEIAQKPEAVARFKREATAAAQLKSPHVVQIFDHGVTSQGAPFIVMELLEGEDVGKRIGRLGRLPLSEVCTIVTQACKALGKAHARGIVHRDIKPDNIYLVDSDGELFIKLLDFGIAKRTEDSSLNMTTTGTMVGTPYFMSPEQVMSAKDADFRSDLWSLAVVAYNALSGRVPFFAETLGALCVAIHSGHHEPVTRDCSELPSALDGWFQRALARDPQVRFASAKEMAVTFAQAAGAAIPPTTSLVGVNAVSVDGARTAVINTPDFGTPSPMPGPGSSTLHAATITHAGSAKSHKRVALLGLGGAALVVAVVASVLLLRGRKETVASEPAPSILVSPPGASELLPAESALGAPAPAAPTSLSSSAPASAPAESASSRSASIPTATPTPPPRRGPSSSQQAPKAKPAVKASASSAPAKQPATAPKKGKDYGF